MWPLHILVIAQVVVCFVAEGILTYESSGSPDVVGYVQPPREEPPNSWQNILRSAMFRTLSKYTTFSPSLEVKMEADTLLWEKLNGAKYTRKYPKLLDEEENLKTGVLIDLSRENGYLEFRQVDKSLYTLEPKDHRLLAFWRMKMIAPNHYIIQVKVPEEPPIEHLYEYSQKEGLKETRLKEVDYNRSKQNKNGPWKVRARKAYSPPLETYPNRNTFIKQPEHYVVRSQQYNGNRYKIPQNTHRQSKNPRTYLNKPTTQYFTVVGIQTPPPPQKYPTAWTEYSYTSNFPASQVKDFTEFKQETNYDGFVPSLGPASSPALYQSAINNPPNGDTLYKQPAVPLYTQTTHYFPQYTPQQPPTQQPPYPAVTYFKPSTQFVQYSEIDPFYSSSNDSLNSYGVINTAAAGLSLLGQLPLYYNSIPPAAISVEVPPANYGSNFYDLAVQAVRNDSYTTERGATESAAQPTATSFTINYSPETESNDNPQYSTESSQLTTIEVLKPTITEVGQTKTRVKNSLKNPLRTLNSGVDASHEYAPSYIKWGEKIKPISSKGSQTERPNTQRVIFATPLSTTTPTTNKFKETSKPNNDSKFTENKPTLKGNKHRSPISILKSSERLQELQKRRLSLKSQKQPKPEESSNPQNTTSIDNVKETVVNNTVIGFNNTNYNIGNITIKSPEEIVSDYTIMGLKNSTNAENSENLRNTNAKNLASEPKNKEEDNHHEGSEPVSVVVSRISHSYSYKTADGESGDLKQIVEKE